ncbi:GIY-YIG nuclease family protein [Salinimicrobium sp. TH3]|uniref:GIY-YIG nuclease family protein n=1 Tax=Salinimicrobium sp. TH3 TaxID=2997342 RepID=UPI002274F55C|nr:GIY-YIG nuclease family protein [Salinimicrobium sp. TH3]MCY2688515.1 GIY-YIG nuclease family protein [Salinimicrobium sp. TH3]
MHFLYIMFSQKSNKYFTGETNNVPARLELHNSYKTIKAFTKAAYDWEVKLIFKCNSREEAVYLKRNIKSRRSRTFIEKVIIHPKILTDLLRERKINDY